jgi:hypothetical protein
MKCRLGLPPRQMALAICLLSIAGAFPTRAEDAPVGPQPVAAAAADAVPGKAGTPEKAATAPAAAPSAAGKEPKKEAKGDRKKRFFRTPAGTILLIVAGALVAGGVAQASLGDKR